MGGGSPNWEFPDRTERQGAQGNSWGVSVTHYVFLYMEQSGCLGCLVDNSPLHTLVESCTCLSSAGILRSGHWGGGAVEGEKLLLVA